jgi:hypothetical protein
MRAAVITAIYDGYDSLKEIVPQDGVDVDWVLLTDDPTLTSAAGTADPRGWRVVYVPRPQIHPCRAAKNAKMLPSLFTDAPHSVWVDASFRITSPRFVIDTLAIAESSESGIAQFKHPWRNCLFEEADASLDLARYAGETDSIKRQVATYADLGMPINWGLWATGVIARWQHDQHYDWGADWLSQNNVFSYQDQISHPFSCWKYNLRPTNLTGTHFVNPWVTYEGSGRHSVG